MKLKRKIYTSLEYIEDERLFFNPLNVNQTKRYISIVRRKTAKRLFNSANKDMKKGFVAGRWASRTTPETSLQANSGITKNLLRKAHNKGSRVFKMDAMGDGGNYFINFGSGSERAKSITALEKLGNRDSQKVAMHLKNPKKHSGVITVSPQNGIGLLSHEVGHLENATSKNPVKQYISKKMTKDAPGFQVRSSGAITTNNPVKVGYEGLIRVAEEGLATKSGLKNLKVNPEIQAKEKKRMKYALQSYISSAKGQTKAALANLIQVPDKRFPITTIPQV